MFLLFFDNRFANFFLFWFQGDELKVKVNKLTSTKTQLPYSFYSIPYCAPKTIVDSAENLGEVLRGDRIENSPYVVSFCAHNPPLAFLNFVLSCTSCILKLICKCFCSSVCGSHKCAILYVVLYLMQKLQKNSRRRLMMSIG